MKDFPLSVLSAAARSTVGGVLAFQAGLTGAGLIVFAEGLDRAGTWVWCLFAWMALIPFTIARLWGLLLAPVLVVMFFGAVWREWNRLMVAGATALALAATTLVCARHNPLADRASATAFLITTGLAMALIALGAALEILKIRAAAKPRPPPSRPPIDAAAGDSQA